MPFPIARPLSIPFGAWALALLLHAPGEASAAERTVYTGTLQGVGDIVMELDSAAADGELTGRYFYPNRWPSR